MRITQIRLLSVLPVLKAWQIPTEDKTIAGLVAWFSFLWEPVFWVGWGMAAALSAADYLLGSYVAYRGLAGETYDGQRASNGFLVKLTALSQLIFMRILERWAFDANLIPIKTMGFFASVVTLGVIVHEWISINRKREHLGAQDRTVFMLAMRALLDMSRRTAKTVADDIDEEA